MLSSQRYLFDIPEDIAYLNCAYMSPQLRSVREAGERALALKSQPWEITPSHRATSSTSPKGLAICSPASPAATRTVSP